MRTRATPVQWGTLVFLLTAVVAAAFVMYRGQDNNVDLHNYHYFSGYSFLHWRFNLDIAPSSVQTYFHPLPNLLAYVAFAYMHFPWSALTLLAVQITVVPAMLLVVREVGKSLGHANVTGAEVLATAICLISPLWWSELGTSFYSSTTAPLVVFGLWLLLRVSNAPTGESSKSHTRNWLILTIAGGLFGLAMALKLTNGMFAVAGGVAVLAVSVWRGPRFAIAAAFAYSAGVALGLLANAWWYGAIYAKYGNPVFPWYNALFQSPYFAPVNLRDERWAFATVGEFGRYLATAWSSTAKTSEVPFRDARITLAAALALAVALRWMVLALRGGLRGSARREPPTAASALLWFFFAGWILWAYMLAYQRYLIPLELVTGAVLWVLLRRLGGPPKTVVLGLAACALVAGVALRVPDWGHIDAREAHGNAFGIDVPQAFRQSPADYLLVGFPSGSILPYLHPESRFYRGEFSLELQAEIRRRLAARGDRPVRLLTLVRDRDIAVKIAAEFGFQPSGECTTFRTYMAPYLICELAPIAPASQ